MKQAILNAPGSIELREVPEPVPGSDDVLLRIRRIGVCGSDVHAYHGTHPYTRCPVIQGHEFCAVIEAVGQNVAGLQRGMKVTAMPQVVCGKCRPCRRGDYHICDELKVQGFQAPGCAQEFFVTQATSVVPLPAAFSFEQGALVEPAAVAVHAVRRAGDLAGKNVAVLGAGPIGNLVAQVARSAGANVLITDVSDHRLEFACDCRLSTTSNAKRETLPEAARRVFGTDGFDAALECVGAEQTAEAAIKSIQKGGTIVIVGVFREKPTVNLGLVQDRELNLRGTLMYRREDYDRAVQLIDEGEILTEPLDSKHFPLQEYATAYAFIETEGHKAMKIFIDV